MTIGRPRIDSSSSIDYVYPNSQATPTYEEHTMNTITCIHCRATYSANLVLMHVCSPIHPIDQAFQDMLADARKWQSLNDRECFEEDSDLTNPMLQVTDWDADWCNLVFLSNN